MSYHSRSSSEVEVTPYGEIIQIFFKDFREDFDFNDVKDNVRYIFTDNEFDYIAKEKGDAQIWHLIWLLQSKSEDDILKFFDLIYPDYKWIVDKIKTEANDHSDDTINFLENLKSIQRDFQNHTDYNVHRTKQFLSLRLALRRLNPKKGLNSVVLLGDLCSGKKWLALDVCSEFGVLKRMKFKIFWIDCSNCTSQQEDYNALKILMIKLNPLHQFDSGNISENLLRLKEHIKLQLKAKEYNDCLLVLTNVQNVKCQEAFNLGCKRLIITRNKKVSDSLSPKLNIHLTLDEGLSMKEFYLLLDKYIGKRYNWRKDNSDLANDIYHMSHGDPCMLSIIARNIREKKSNWIEWMKKINDFQIPDVKLQRYIEKSLLILNTYQLQMYATFAVFPCYAQIPVKLLAHLWNIKLFEAEEIVKKFHINSFVQKQILEDNDTIVCRVKYVYSSYIKNCNKMQQLINPQVLHSRIIEYYQVEEHLNIRKDVDLDFDSHDGYFYRWIGCHLYGANMKHLFPRLYKDFGFLGQKMRAVGLNNTLADLRYYDSEIALGDRKYSFKKLKAFLAKIEEKIIHFPDCCLLQYALLSDDFIREMALQQIEKFPRRLWFSERGQYQQWRFIFSLPQPAKIVRILDHDLCIVVLANNNNTFLVDLSLDSRCSLLQLIDGVNIIDIKIFDNNNHMLTLDRFGYLNLWHIAVEKRRILNQRRNIKANFNPNSACKASQLTPKQSINDYLNCLGNIQAFYLEVVNETNCTLLVALNTGMLKFFDWNQITKEFEQKSYQIPHRTSIEKIHSICKIQTHYMIVNYTENSTINTTFLKLRNTERETKKFSWPENVQLVYQKVYGDVVLLVFNHVVLRLSLKFYPAFDGQLDVLYDSPNCIINCGKMLLDNQYLMLGTENGLKIFDITNGHETLQSSVSENISSVDNYDLDDEEFKSMIVCGCSNKNIVYIFGLRLASDGTLVWEHNAAHRAEDLAHLEHLKHTRFLGQTMFDVNEENDTLYAVDSKNRIHQIYPAETKNWSIIPSLDTQQKIIGINCFKNSVIVAFENGDIYDLQQKRLIVKANEIVRKEFFLKTVDDNILVTSSAKEMTYVKHMTNENEKTIKALTKYCNMVMESHLLIVNNFGATLFFNCENNFAITIGIRPHCLLASCDLKDNVLFLGFSSYAVHIYSLEKNSEDDSIDCHKRSEILPHKDVRITCLTASNDAKLLAIGLKSEENNSLRSCGDIEIFKLNDDYKPQLIYCLKSHVKPINNLLFSPQNEILVSIAEQICFWNINYVLNNPLDVGNRKRHSSRFTSQKSAEEVDFKVESQQQRRDRFLNLEQKLYASFESHMTHKVGHNYSNNNNSLEQSTFSEELNDDSVFGVSVEKNDESLWSCLTGPCDKPELLSCLKLDGNEAKLIFANKNFTEFYTIDDEGVYYNLERIKPKTLPTPEDVDMPDSSSSSINMEYLDVQRLSIDSSIMSGADVVDTANT